MYLEPAAQTPESQTSVIRQPRPLPVEHVQLELTPDLKQAVPSQQTKKRFLLSLDPPMSLVLSVGQPFLLLSDLV
jgi:hypothetical protein